MYFGMGLKFEGFFVFVRLVLCKELLELGFKSGHRCICTTSNGLLLFDFFLGLSNEPSLGRYEIQELLLHRGKDDVGI